MTQKYASVNGAWPVPARQLPKLTAAEAATATKRLWKLTTGRKLAKTTKLTSGNRRNRMRFSTVVLNPDQGWWSLVHFLSHFATWRLYPGSKAHDDKGRHAFIERTMIEHVVNSGWLEGKLKRPEKQKAVADVRTVRHQRVLASTKRWEAKLKRAETALRKLRRQARYYERAASASAPA